MTKLVNLTPHDIVLRNAEGADTVIPTSGAQVRVSMTPGTPATVAGIPCPVYSPDTVGGVVGLPDPEADTLYIVSAVAGAAIAESMPHRKDVVMPGTAPNDEPVRNEKGHVVAVTRLKMVS